MTSKQTHRRCRLHRREVALALPSLILLAAGAAAQQPPPIVDPVGLGWAFPNPEMKLEPESPGAKTVPGSTRTYTPEQIDDLRNPPDWFPESHPPAPRIVVQGRDTVLACGSCHLMNGVGHPESSDLRGFPVDYFIQQMADFRNDARLDYAGVMNKLARAMTDEEVRAAGEWFEGLDPTPVGKVIEAATVPATYVGNGFMRFRRRDGATESLGMRIITIPDDETRARRRDPNSGFISYVPIGSLARGQVLVETGGEATTVACASCHGDGFKGLGEVPRIAGQHPIYLVRQMLLFKDGRRRGPASALMQPSVAQLSDADIIAIAAYLGSLEP